MKKIIVAVVILLAIAGAIGAWLFLGSGTAFSEKSRYLYIASGKASERAVMDSIAKNHLISRPGLFSWLGSSRGVWARLKPGRYEIKKGQSLLSITRMLRNNQQSPVNLVINKIRTREELAKVVGKNFEADSSEVIHYLNNDDSLSKLNVDSNTFMTLIIPNTYSFNWTTSPGKIFRRLKTESENFWAKNNRKRKAESMGFSPTQVYTIASIIEEETNKNDEKGNIASVYINRYEKGMPLGADPTIKFALKDFSIKRILYGHLQVQSPYNTYRNRGLPPGPICTPSTKTIDAVLTAPKTDYMFFVAKSDFSGYHTFSSNFAEHIQHAKEYQKALDEYLARKQSK